MINDIDNGDKLEKWLWEHSYSFNNMLAEDTREAFIAATKKALSKDLRVFKKIEKYPVHAPAWLTQAKFRDNGPFYQFNEQAVSPPRGSLNHQLADILYWFQKMQEQNEPPPNCTRMGTMEALSRGAQKALYQRSQKLRREFGRRSFDAAREAGNIEIICDQWACDQQAPRGFRMVQLLTPEAFRYETAYMTHCLMNGQYDRDLTEGRASFYSLRDRLNKSHITIKIQNGQVIEAIGKENKKPVAKYMPYLEEFILKNQYHTSLRTAVLHGLWVQEGRVYDFHNLPNHFTLKNTNNPALNLKADHSMTFDFTAPDKSFQFPNTLTIESDEEIVIMGQLHQVTFPENLTSNCQITIHADHEENQDDPIILPENLACSVLTIAYHPNILLPASFHGSGLIINNEVVYPTMQNTIYDRQAILTKFLRDRSYGEEDNTPDEEDRYDDDEEDRYDDEDPYDEDPYDDNPDDNPDNNRHSMRKKNHDDDFNLGNFFEWDLD